DITAPIRRIALSRLNAMNEVQTATRGQKLFIAYKDYANLKPPLTLYDPGVTPTVRRSSGFENFTKSMLRRVVRGPTVMKDPGHETLRTLATVIREMFKNTDDWART